MTAAPLSPAAHAAAVPVGGPTGLDHESTARIDEAATWLATMAPGTRPHPVVPALKARFGLCSRELPGA